MGHNLSVITTLSFDGAGNLKKISLRNTSPAVSHALIKAFEKGRFNPQRAPGGPRAGVEIAIEPK